jgi:hypothetical protein
MGKKTKTYLLLGLAVLISIIHTWHPVTLSPTNSGDRTMFMFVILLLAVAARSGYSSSRIAIGGSFLFCATINLLIAVFYNLSNGLASFIEILFWGLALGATGLALLIWKDVRYFEENRFSQNAQSV